MMSEDDTRKVGGDQTTINTGGGNYVDSGGGDVAGRDIDKRQGEVFVDGNVYGDVVREQDEGHPIPVVFNLSSWATKQRPLKDWLVEELNTKYDVPRKVGEGWMDTDAVLPLLDGLDEVAAEQRVECAAVINTYRQEHGL